MSAIGMAGKMASQDSMNLKVFVRCRPTNQNENKHPVAVQIPSSKELVVHTHSKMTKTFNFCEVFDPSTTQLQVFRTAVEPLVADVLAGYNCTLFAYGQTGSGKTHTVEGDFSSTNTASVGQIEEESNAGIAPRVFAKLFEELDNQHHEYTMSLSCIEIYNEEIYDLLSPGEIPPKLKMFDDPTKKGSVVLPDVCTVLVHKLRQALNELTKACAKRHTAATRMNINSSRSHLIYTLALTLKESKVQDDMFRLGKLHLIDLAGSENIGKSGSGDKKLREASSINQSLLTLGRVITCLTEHQPHIPFRESKLTRFLKDSLGGTTKTTMIATISTSAIHVDETLSTLDYATRAKSIINKPVLNEKITNEDAKKEFSKLIESYRNKLQLHQSGNGVFLAHENYLERRQKLKDSAEKIKVMTATFRDQLEKKKEIEEKMKVMRRQETVKKERLENLREECNRTKLKIESVRAEEAHLLQDLNDLNRLVKIVSDKEEKLTGCSKKYVSYAEEFNKDGDVIHNKLDGAKVILQHNNAALRGYSFQWQNVLSNISALVQEGMKSEDVQQALKLFHALRQTLSIQDNKILSYVIQIQDIIQEFSNRLNKELENSNLEVDKLCQLNAASFQQFVNNRVALLNFFNKKMRTILKSLSSLGADLKKHKIELAEAAASVAVRMEDLILNINNKNLSMNEFKNMMEAHAAQFTRQLKLTEDATKEKLNQSKGSSKSCASALSQTREAILAAKENVKKDHETFTTLNHRVAKSGKLLSKAAVDSSIMDIHRSEWSSRCDEIDLGFKNCVESLMNINQQQSSRMSSICEKFKKSMEDEKCSVEEAVHAEIGNQDSANLESRKLCTEAQNSIAASKQQSNVLLEELQYKLSEATAEFSSRVLEQSESVKLFVVEEQQIFQKKDDTKVQIDRKIRDEIKKGRDLALSTFEKDIGFVKTTGHTPMKKDYDLAAKLDGISSPDQRKVSQRAQIMASKIKKISQHKKSSKVKGEDGYVSDSDIGVRKFPHPLHKTLSCGNIFNRGPQKL